LPILPYNQSKIEREIVITLIRPENFEAEISETNQPVLLAYISRGHHDRKQIDILHQVAKQVHPLIKFGLLDQNCTAGLEPLNLKGSPTFIIFEEGEEKKRMLGKTDRKALSDFIMQALPDLLSRKIAGNKP